MEARKNEIHMLTNNLKMCRSRDTYVFFIENEQIKILHLYESIS